MYLDKSPLSVKIKCIHFQISKFLEFSHFFSVCTVFFSIYTEQQKKRDFKSST